MIWNTSDKLEDTVSRFSVGSLPGLFADGERCAEGRELAKHFGCRFIETSAKQRLNVDEAFSNLVREIRKYNKVRPSPPVPPRILT